MAQISLAIWESSAPRPQQPQVEYTPPLQKRSVLMSFSCCNDQAATGALEICCPCSTHQVFTATPGGLRLEKFSGPIKLLQTGEHIPKHTVEVPVP